MKKMILVISVILAGASLVQGDTEWTSGHHEIVDGDVYGEISIYNDVTLDISGGQIGRLETYDVTLTDLFGGEMSMLWTYYDSTVNLHGGTLGTLLSEENSLVNIYGYDVVITDTGGGWDRGQVTGTYFLYDTPFVIDLWSQDTGSHINVIPEPPVDVEIDIHPDTLNLSSKGKWITCYIWLPEDYNVADIEPNSVVIENEPNDIYPEWIWFEEQEQVAMAKFNRAEIQGVLEPGQVGLTVTGELIDGTRFEGSHTIRVIRRGRKKD